MANLLSGIIRFHIAARASSTPAAAWWRNILAKGGFTVTCRESDTNPLFFLFLLLTSSKANLSLGGRGGATFERKVGGASDPGDD